MKQTLLFFAFALALCLEAQAQVNNIVLNAGVAYTNGAPTFRPGGKGSRIAIDTVTWIWYESLDNNTGNWIESGYRVQPISGCVAPAYTPNKHQSVLVINGCDSLYYYRAGAWRHINPGGVSGVAWGDITGDITNQTDLQTALSDKADAAHNHPLSDVLQSGATSGQVPKWNGSAWVPATDDNTGTTYTAGIGIAISGGNVISNTGDLSNTNEIELPAQAGNSGKYLTTNGTAPSWATVSGGGATDLSISGTSSPLTLNSSTGTDVTITAGAGISLAGSGSNVTITNTGDATASDDITGSGTSGQVAYFNGTQTVTSSSNFTYSGGQLTVNKNAFDKALQLSNALGAGTGLTFSDATASLNIWYYGPHGSLNIGGGGGTVAGKLLHIHGGATIGTSMQGVLQPTNGLLVQGVLSCNSSSVAGTNAGLYVGGVQGIKAPWGTTAERPTISSSSDNGIFRGNATLNTFEFGTSSGWYSFMAGQPTGFTTGSIPFYSGANFIENNSNLFWNNSSSLLGIGTASPSAKLHISAGAGGGIKVEGTSFSDNNLKIVNPTSTGTGMSFADVNSKINIFYNGNGSTISVGGSGSGVVGKTMHIEKGVSIGESMDGYTGGTGTLVVENSISAGSVSSTIPARIYSKGSGTTSSTYSIIATNSGGDLPTAALAVRDDGLVGIGTNSPNASAKLEVSSTTGGILFPRMTTTQRDAIATPADGLVIYNTTTSKFQGRAGGAWVDLH